MNVTTYHPDSDLTNVTGFTVVIDVFRAFTVAYYVLDNRPARYWATASLETARQLKRSLPRAVLIAERGGLKCDGADFGNSPTEIVGQDFRGLTVIHTTTAGTQGLVRQPGGNPVVVGSFVNAGAIVKHVHDRGIDHVNLYCSAAKDSEYGEEDRVFAKYLESRLHGGHPSLAVLDHLRRTCGQGFREGGFAPPTDLDFCLDVDRFDGLLARAGSPFPDVVELTELSAPL